MSSLLTKNTYKQPEHSNLPLEGWLKPCVNKKCSIITSNTFIHNNVKYYCCKKCLSKYEMVHYVTQILKL
jgi:hypothetical protein